MSDPKQRKLTSWHVLSMGLLVAALALSSILATFHGNQVALAQSRNTPASLSGSIYDASRATIPGVMVIISSPDGKTKEIVYAGNAGEYKFAVLPDGTYTVEVSKPGFRSHQEKNVVIESGKPQRLDLTLEVGEVSQYIEVVGKSPRVTPASQARQPHRIRVGGNVQQANLIHEVRPDYPEASRQAGIEGTISLEAIIGKDGTVVNQRVLSTLADPSLAKAASEAVKQWRYQPTLLNGEPIEVVTTITINFRLSEP